MTVTTPPTGVTRDPESSPRTAELFQAFNHCANGYDATTVFEAAVNLVIAAIVYRSHRDLDEASSIAEQTAALLPNLVRRQILRPADPTDVKVPHGN